MKSVLLVFIFLTQSLFANLIPDIEASKEKRIDTRENYFLTSTDYRITPKVNPITGEYCEEEVELVVAGSQPLSVRRFYNHFSPHDHRYANWRYNPEAFFVANFEFNEQELFAAIGNNDGSMVQLKASEKKSAQFDFQTRHFIAGAADGQTHPANIQINYQRTFDPKNGVRFDYSGTVQDGSGRVRSFSSGMHTWLHEVVYHIRKDLGLTKNPAFIVPQVWTPYHIPIREERLPNGNILCYCYEKWIEAEKDRYPRPLLIHNIIAYNSDRSKVLGSLEFKYKRSKDNHVTEISLYGSDGRTAWIQHIDPVRLGAVRRPDQSAIDYGYTDGKLNRVQKPDGRVLTTDYDAKTNKVTAQYAPVGPNGEMCPIGRYDYHDKATIVYDAENNQVIYRFDDHKRITSIESYQGDQLYRIDRFIWNDETGNLIRKTIEDRSGNPLQITEYKYDDHQNPIEERMGDGKEWITIKRSYNQQFNVKETETFPDGKIIYYNYVPGTNLLASEYVYDGSQMRKRTFHTYDDCAVCIKTIVDDGVTADPNDLTGVTYRKIIVTQPKATMPCLGLPEVVEEKTIDAQGQEILLKKVVYTYTPFGKVEKEDHYDADGVYCYSIHNQYERELLHQVTDAVGNTTAFTYDQNQNLTSIQGPKPDQLKTIEYDKANRPICLTDTQVGSIRKQYDKLGRMFSETDVCGNLTRFEYDSLSRVTAIHHPDGAVERKEYDILGNVTKMIDGEGYETRTTYDFRGKPTSIYYPDGKEEHFTYHANGTLATHVDKNGAKSVYRYDIFENPIQVEVFSSSGELLKVTSATYTPFCKTSETNAEGVTTYFHHDFAGRKIAEETGSKVTQYSYDSLGRLAKTYSEHYSSHQEYSSADQVIRKTIEAEALQFEESYAYDEAGNRTHLMTARGIFETGFNSFGKALFEKDPLNNTTSHSYHFGKEYREVDIDPKGIQTVRVYDKRGREAECAQLNTQGETLSRNTNHYDRNGQLVKTTHFVYEDTHPVRSVTHQWVYGPSGRIERFLEAGEKETKYLYDSKGRLQTILKPSGKQLHHEWDDLGRLARYFSTDFDYHYQYDRCDRVISVYDTVSQTTTSRSYDHLGNIIQETLANGLTFINTYDSQGRRTSLILPDNTQIDYTYKGAYLYRVSRNNLHYTYQHRSLDGLLIQAELPSDLGLLTIARDPLSRWIQTDSPYFRSKMSYDAVGNLMTYTFYDPLGTVDNQYTYDDLNQLISETEHTYTYDSLHNRLQKNNLPHQVNHLNQLTHDGQTAYHYDADGNLLTDGHWHYTYDSQDRLTTASNGQTTLTFTYDPFHRRLSKNTTHYLWDGNNEIGSFTTHITELRILGEGLGAEIGAATLLELNNTPYLPLHDHRGCLTTLTNLTTHTTEPYRYTAFGEPLTPSSTSPWRFSSKRTDETSLLFFGRRYYSPTTGRWITQDPEGFRDGPNLYAYVCNSPLTEIDLYGLFSFGGCLRSMSQMAFRGIEWFGANLLPVPIVRGFVESVGRWGAGGDFLGPSRYRSSGNEVITIPGRTVPGLSYSHGNGMLTSREDAIRQAEYISRTHGNAQVDLLYHGSQGLIMDLINCGFSKMGLPTSYNFMCANYYREKFKANRNHRFISSVHSRGGTQIMNTGRLLSPRQREQIDVIAYGSATQIPNRYFRSAENNLTLLDLVPMSNPLAYSLGFISSKLYNINIVPSSTGCPLKAHGFLESSYSERIRINGEKFKELYFDE